MKCDMDTLISTIASKRLDKHVEVTFALLGGLPDCKRINAKDYLKVIDAENADVDVALQYNKFDRPEEAFECGGENACFNTGSLALAAATNYAVFKLPYDGTKFSSGIVTLYVKGFTGAKNVTVKISDTANFANADIYTVSAVGKTGEFTPVAIDLASTPTSTAGDGWTANPYGNYIAINVSDANAMISSIAVFDSIEDFENNDVVKMQCLTGIENEEAIEAAEATCANPNVRHDTTSPTFEGTITGSKVTENFNKLNPLVGKGTATKAYEIATQKFTPVLENGYAKVTVADAYQDECGFITAQAECSLLKRYDIPVLVAIDEDHFIVMANEDGTTDIFFHANLAGHEVVISYPREAEVDEYIGDIDNVDTVVKRTKVYVPYQLSNGKRQAKVYGNVLITSISAPRNEDETEYSVSYSIQKAEDGHYYHIYDYK